MIVLRERQCGVAGYFGLRPTKGSQALHDEDEDEEHECDERECKQWGLGE
jgi:hypothetical protein